MVRSAERSLIPSFPMLVSVRARMARAPNDPLSPLADPLSHQLTQPRTGK